MAQDEEEYRSLLRDLRCLYQHEKPDGELKILAFVRRDRYVNMRKFCGDFKLNPLSFSSLQTERLAAKQGRESVYVTSPAADEADYRTHLIPKKVAKTGA